MAKAKAKAAATERRVARFFSLVTCAQRGGYCVNVSAHGREVHNALVRHRMRGKQQYDVVHVTRDMAMRRFIPRVNWLRA
eukprot:5006794-Amphidinium_carterae.1